MSTTLMLRMLTHLDTKAMAFTAALVIAACIVISLASNPSCQQQLLQQQAEGEEQRQQHQPQEALEQQKALLQKQQEDLAQQQQLLVQQQRELEEQKKLLRKQQQGQQQHQLQHQQQQIFSDSCLEEALIKAEKALEISFASYSSHRSRWRSSEDSIFFVSEALVPFYPCVLEERFGSWGEGGKWVCMAHYPHKSGGVTGSPPVVVSIGSRGERSFEEAIHERLGVVPHTYDPFLPSARDATMFNLTSLKFHKAGLVGSHDLEGMKKQLRGRADAFSLKGLLEDLNTTHIDIFKIDCEGCEYEVVKDIRSMWSREDQPLGQIQMEIHCVLNKTRSHCAPLMDNLIESGYRLFHAEPNGHSATCFELAWIHESLVKPRSLPT